MRKEIEWSIGDPVEGAEASVLDHSNKSSSDIRVAS